MHLELLIPGPFNNVSTTLERSISKLEGSSQDSIFAVTFIHKKKVANYAQ